MYTVLPFGLVVVGWMGGMGLGKMRRGRGERGLCTNSVGVMLYVYFL